MKKKKIDSFWKPIKHNKQKKVSLKIKPVSKLKKKELNWVQAKKRYPKMKGWKDADKDGVRNSWDCKPFDKKKQGFQHQYSFSGSDYNQRVVKMPPELFLKTTYGETRRRKTFGSGGTRGKTDTARYGAQIQNVPEDYEKYKEEVSGLSPKNRDIKHKQMGRVIKSKKTHLPVPFLEFRELEYRKGKYKRTRPFPAGHEGRNTALAAQRLGLKYIPVTIEQPKGVKISKKYEELEEFEEAKQLEHDRQDRDKIISAEDMGYDYRAKEKEKYKERYAALREAGIPASVARELRVQGKEQIEEALEEVDKEIETEEEWEEIKDEEDQESTN